MLQAVAVPDQPAERRVPGRPWAKGQSGNPSGKPKYKLPNGKSVAEMARDLTPRALALLVRVMDDETQPMALRLGCAQTLLQRGWADMPRDNGAMVGELSIVVHKLIENPQPTRGVLASPIAAHVWVETRDEVTDAALKKAANVPLPSDS